MQILICLGLFIPLFSFLLLVALSRFLSRNTTSWIACSAVFLSFCCFLSLLYFYTSQDIESTSVKLFTWIQLPGIVADFALRLDHLSLLMTLIITGVGFLIHVYSIGYTDHETDYVRYFAFLNFFIFAMLLLVLAANLLLLFVGWEGVGLASYLLIGYWYKTEVAAKAATKAFVMNRIGDFGFLIGLLLTFYLFQTTDIETISNEVGKLFSKGDATLTLLTLLFFVGAVGKSAQIPLHTWLPSAMAGPTPVSALIHAATMVTAGVYLVVRMHTVYSLTPLTLDVIGIIGAATALYAAVSAIAQTDLKKVLAYSTLSQLGLMFLACGAGAFYSAMFHLTMHAFIKGLLFLAAGNVVHMLHGTTEMEKMGGLSKKFPITHWLFLIGVLALSGIPPFAAFFSKDLILEQEYLAGYHTLFYIGLTASILTGFYMTRSYFLTFRGPLKPQNQLAMNAKEAPPVMLIPVSILAFLALTGGILGATDTKMPILENFLSAIGIRAAEQDLSHGFIASKEAYMTIFGALFGVIIPCFLYTRYKDKLPKGWTLLKNAFFVDQFYDAAIVKPLKSTSKIIVDNIEPGIFAGSISSLLRGVKSFSLSLQEIQNGQIRSYAAFFTIASALFLFYYFK